MKDAIKYDGNNFVVWRARFEAAAAEKDLAINLKEARPDDGREAQAAWDARELKLRGKLISWLDDTHVRRVAAIKTVNESLTYLEGRAVQRGGQAQGRLRDRWCDMVMGDKESAQAWLDRVRTMAEDMEAAGITLGGGELTAKMLSGLPRTDADWRMTKIVIQGRSDFGDLTDEQIADLLLAAQESRDADGKKGSLGLANAAGGGDKKCFKCGKPGHVKAECKAKDKSKFEGTCNNCKKSGHKAADCYAKGGAKEGQGPRHRGKATAH
jgi:hypothetical protein